MERELKNFLFSALHKVKVVFTLYPIAKRSVAESVPDRFSKQFLCHNSLNSCSHCTGAIFETEQKPVRYSVNIAQVCSISFEAPAN